MTPQEVIAAEKRLEKYHRCTALAVRLDEFVKAMRDKKSDLEFRISTDGTLEYILKGPYSRGSAIALLQRSDVSDLAKKIYKLIGEAAAEARDAARKEASEA